MSNYTWKYIQKHPQEVKRLLGIDFEQLQQLLEQGSSVTSEKARRKRKAQD